MQKKLLIVILVLSIIIAAMPILQTTAVIPGPEFAMTINGKFSSDTIPVEFEGLHACENITVEIVAWMVEDLYAYEFTVGWNPYWLKLVKAVGISIHTDDFLIAQEFVNHAVLVPPDGADLPSTHEGLAGFASYYLQAVTAKGTALGVTGTFVIATLTFHIERDACWPTDYLTEIYFVDPKMSDSCGHTMDPSNESGWIEFISVPPQIKMKPFLAVKSIVGDTFDVEIEVQHVVRMKSFELEIWWDPTQITTDIQNIWITEFLPPPYEVKDITVGDDYLWVSVIIPCEKPAISGTGVILKIRFTTLDPWGKVYTYRCATPSIKYKYERLAIPPYYDFSTAKLPHRWAPDKCWNFIDMCGYIDVYCPEYKKMYLDDWHGVWVLPWNYTAYEKACFTKEEYCNPALGVGPFLYEFRPIPGDLNLDGKVDIVDLSAIAKQYGKSYALARGDWPFRPPHVMVLDPTEWTAVGVYDPLTGCFIWSYHADFDLTTDGVIDIFDVVVVAKNFNRVTPDPDFPQPLPNLDP